LSAPAASGSSVAGRPLLAFLTCSAIWGSTFLAIRLGNDTLPPLWGASLRLGLAAVLLTTLVRATGRRLPSGPARRAAAQFGFLNFGLSFCLLYWGELYVPTGITAVVYATVPLTTAITTRAIGLERPSPLKLLAGVVALAGVAALFSGEMTRAVPFAPLLAILGAATCAAFSGVALKLGPRQDPIGTNAVAAMVGFVVCLAASFLRREPHPLPTSASALLPLAYLAIVGSIGAFVLYAWLVNQWPLSRISFIAVIVPVVATALGVLVRHESLSPMSVVGAAVVLSGVVVALVADRGASEAH